MPCRDSGLPHDTRNIMGTSGNIFERLPAREGQSSTLLNNSKNLSSSSLKLGPNTEGSTKRPVKEMRREPQHSSIPVPRFQSGGGLLNLLRMVSWIIREIRSWNCLENSWKLETISRQKCVNSVFPQITMHWIKEVEIATSIDEIMISQSITGRRDFPDYEVLGAMIASALKNTITGVQFRRKVSVEEQRAQKDDRFLREGRLLTGHRSS